VCIGRGKKYVKHNRRFLTIIDSEADAYAAAISKALKSSILARVFDLVRNVKKGTFVKVDSESGRWFVVEDSLARTTIAQALRDANNKTYRSSKQSKQQRRRYAKISTDIRQNDEVIDSAVPSMMTVLDCAWTSLYKAQSVAVVSPSVSAEGFGSLGYYAPTSNPRNIHLRDILDELADIVNIDMGVNDDPFAVSPAQVAPCAPNQDDDSFVFPSILKLFDSQFVDRVKEIGNPFEPTPLPDLHYQGPRVFPKQQFLVREVDDDDHMDLLDILDVSDIEAAFA
jgi:hypothetical protein